MRGPSITPVMIRLDVGGFVGGSVGGGYNVYRGIGKKGERITCIDYKVAHGPLTVVGPEQL